MTWSVKQGTVKEVHIATKFPRSNYKTPISKPKVAGGALAGGALALGGYKAFQHRSAIKAKAVTMHSGIHNSFHSTHSSLGT